jgi:DegV family protein with EDD domain
VFGSETYRDDAGFPRQQFYNMLSEKREIPSTATPPPSVYEEVYRQLAEETDEIVSVHLASHLSSLHDVAVLAASAVSAAGVRIAVIDSQQVTMGYGWMAIAAAEAAQRGQSLEQIVNLVNAMKERSRVLAILDTLDFLHRGGRVGWVKALLGTLLRIKPMIEIRMGEVALVERTRTQARALDRLLERIEMLGPLSRAIVLHTNAPHLAERLADQLKAIAPTWEKLIGHAGVTIASHAGPGAVGVALVTAK